MMMGSLPTVIAIGRSSPRASARQLHGNVALRHGLNSDTVRALHHEPIDPRHSPRRRCRSPVSAVEAKQRHQVEKIDVLAVLPRAGDAETALIALHSKLRPYWRERRCVEEKLARGDTPDPCMAPLPPRALQNSAGVACRPFAQTTATCVRFVTPNLRMICRT
jgi:hypothetical protein